MNENILLYEELSLNALPALQTQFYDGWILRYTNGYGYTNRANSVNMLYPANIGMNEKVTECEKRYFAQGLPAVFKITDGADESIDSYLETKDYAVVTPTYLMAADMESVTGVANSMGMASVAGVESVTGATSVVDVADEAGATSVVDESGAAGVTDVAVNSYAPGDCVLTNSIDNIWLDACFRLSDYTDSKKIAIARQVFSNIKVAVLCGRIVKNGTIIACGLCAIERGYAGLYNIVVNEEQRGKGYGKTICVSLLAAAKRYGAHTTYLQVVQDNNIAIKLYTKLGYRRIYSYWYRKKGV